MAETVSESLFVPTKRTLNTYDYPSPDSSSSMEDSVVSTSSFPSSSSSSSFSSNITNSTGFSSSNPNLIHFNNPFNFSVQESTSSITEDSFSHLHLKKRLCNDSSEKFVDSTLKTFSTTNLSNSNVFMKSSSQSILKNFYEKSLQVKDEKISQLTDQNKKFSSIIQKKDDDIKILSKGINIQENKLKKQYEEYEKLKNEGHFYINNLVKENEELKNTIEKLMHEKKSQEKNLYVCDNTFFSNFSYNNPPPPPGLCQSLHDLYVTYLSFIIIFF